MWGKIEDDRSYHEAWVKRFEDAAEAISIRDPSNSRGLLPAFAKRLLDELRGGSGLNWRELLCNFVQEEVNDYSFSPPDRRYGDSDFFLPDFNDTDEQVKNVLFMIDTSGSMSDKMITEAYSEIASAIEQFGGKLQGWLGFFDAAIIEPKPFVGLDELLIIRPAGGGGTDFGIVFEYVRDYMSDEPPVSIVVLTDGYAPFPEERMAMGIPVLWLINNKDVTPPWGKVARIISDK
jgi:predicted metal-dependent peptidase